jgi:hypothetical protein
MKSLYLWLSVFALGCTGSVANPSAGAGGNSSLPGGGSSGSSFPGGGASGDGANAGTGANNAGNAGASGNAGAPAAEVTAQPSWRLTNAEYKNTVHDLFGIDATAPLDPDGAAAGFSAGLEAGDATVAAYHQAAIQVGSQSAALLSKVPCDQAAITANPADCAAKFIDSVGPKAFRHPVDADTRAALVALFGSVNGKFGFNAGLQALVEEMMQSPYFLYHLELEEQAKGPGKVAVTGYSMASRLSYLIYASMPDDELFAQAAAGALSTPEQISAQAMRMLSTDRAKAGLRNFYEQWLKVRALPASKGGNFAALYDAASVLGSFDAQVDAALWAPKNSLTTLLTGTQAYVNDKTAQLFGVNGITGSAYQPVTVDATQRAGILMHPAIMATFGTETGSHPIKRGVFVWDQVVCQELGDPPPNVPAFPPVPANSSVRQAYETFTSPVQCQVCHQRINPVGFLFESYDTIGRYRTIDDNGQPVNSAVTVVKATDTTGADDAKLNVATPNAVQFAANLASDPSVTTQCLVTQLYRYSLRRITNAADKPTIGALAADYTTNEQNMSKLINGLAQTQGFLNRLTVQ